MFICFDLSSSFPKSLHDALSIEFVPWENQLLDSPVQFTSKGRYGNSKYVIIRGFCSFWTRWFAVNETAGLVGMSQLDCLYLYLIYSCTQWLCRNIHSLVLYSLCLLLIYSFTIIRWVHHWFSIDLMTYLFCVSIFIMFSSEFFQWYTDIGTAKIFWNEPFSNCRTTYFDG